MAFAISILLFLAGMYLFALAFLVPGFEIAIFIAGVLVVSLALFIPMHLLRKN